MKHIHWLRPIHVAQIEFLEWTARGHLRHPKFVAMREDKSARLVVRESPYGTPQATGEPKRMATKGKSRSADRKRVSAEPHEVDYTASTVQKRGVSRAGAKSAVKKAKAQLGRNTSRDAVKKRAKAVM
jgi:bifunctional non-homologous end joining protein LigD